MQQCVPLTNAYYYSNSTSNDVLFTTNQTNSYQPTRILIGTTSNVNTPAVLVINSNNVYIHDTLTASNLNFTGALQQNGVAYSWSGSQWVGASGGPISYYNGTVSASNMAIGYINNLPTTMTATTTAYTASNSSASNPAWYAFDGNTGTSWQSASNTYTFNSGASCPAIHTYITDYAGECLTIFIPSVQFNAAGIYINSLDNLPEWRLYGSLNATSWTEIVQGGGAQSTFNTSFTPVSYIYYSLVINQVFNNSNARIAEMYLLPAQNNAIIMNPSCISQAYTTNTCSIGTSNIPFNAVYATTVISSTYSNLPIDSNITTPYINASSTSIPSCGNLSNVYNSLSNIALGASVTSQWSGSVGGPLSYYTGIINASNVHASNITVPYLTASNVNASNVTASNINFTGQLQQNGVAYVGSQWTGSVGGPLSYYTGLISASNIYSSNITVPYLTASNVGASNMTTSNITCTGTVSAATVYSSGDVTAFSDCNYKTDLLLVTDACNKVNILHGYTFSRTDIVDSQRYVGLLAQEVESVLPEAVYTNENGKKSLAYGNLAALFVEAIKDLNQRITALEQN